MRGGNHAKLESDNELMGSQINTIKQQLDQETKELRSVKKTLQEKEGELIKKENRINQLERNMSAGGGGSLKLQK